MEGTVFAPSLEGIKHVKSESGVVLTKPFLEVCKHILPVLEKFGSAMSIVKKDIGGNITRLETKYASDPSKYEQLHTMVQVEVTSKTAKSSSCCTNGLLWLTRAMDFLVARFTIWYSTLIGRCHKFAVTHIATLKKWHGWLASSSFSVAIKLAPDRKKFMDIISASGDINVDIEKFCATLSHLLAENHKFLASVRMDDLMAC